MGLAESLFDYGDAWIAGLLGLVGSKSLSLNRKHLDLEMKRN